MMISLLSSKRFFSIWMSWLSLLLQQVCPPCKAVFALGQRHRSCKSLVTPGKWKMVITFYIFLLRARYELSIFQSPQLQASSIGCVFALRKLVYPVGMYGLTNGNYVIWDDVSIFVVQNGGLSVKLQLGSRILHGIKEAAKKKHCVWCLKQIPLVSAAVSYCICWFLWCQWLLNLIAASLLPSVVVSHHKLCCDTHAMIFIWHQSIHPILVQFVSYALSVTLRPKCCGRRPVAQSQQNYVEAPGKSLAVTLTETHPFCQTIRPNARNPCEFYVQRPVLNRTSYLVCK